MSLCVPREALKKYWEDKGVCRHPETIAAERMMMPKETRWNGKRNRLMAVHRVDTECLQDCLFRIMFGWHENCSQRSVITYAAGLYLDLSKLISFILEFITAF